MPPCRAGARLIRWMWQQAAGATSLKLQPLRGDEAAAARCGRRFRGRDSARRQIADRISIENSQSSAREAGWVEAGAFEQRL